MSQEPSGPPGTYPGVGWFNLSWLPWLNRPAVLHDHQFQEVIQGKTDPDGLWQDDVEFEDVLTKEIENRSITSRYLVPAALLTKALSYPVIWGFTLFRWTQGHLGVFKKDD